MAKLIDITGKCISGEWGLDDNDGTGIPVLRTTNFTNDGIVNFSNVVTRQINKKNLSDKYLKPGDIIIEKSGGSDNQPVGRVIYFDGQKNTYLFNNFTGLLRVADQTTWLPKYVFYALFANYQNGGTKSFENKTTGLHNLKTDSYVQSVDIKELSYEDQKHIVTFLDKITHLIFLRKQQLSKLDELVKSRFIELFGEPEQNEKGLPSVPMTDLCEIIDGDRGKNYPKQEEFTEEGFCLFLNAKNVTANGFSFETCMYITEEKDSILRNGKLRRGDVVLTTRGTLGNLAFYDDSVPHEHMRINSGMVILRMKRNRIIERFFIEQFKMQLVSIKEKIASGSAQPQLPISTMNKIVMLVPDVELQDQFAAFVEQIDKSKFYIEKFVLLALLISKITTKFYYNEVS